MRTEIEKKVRNIYKRILLKSNFQSGVYSQIELKKLCNDTKNLDIAYTFYCLQENMMRSREIDDFIEKVKSFVC